MRIHHFCATASAFWALTFVIGCSGDPLGKHAISGSIKVDGVPLESGDVAFQPMDGQATSSGAVVKAGRYTLPRDSGLVVGKYRVAVHAGVPGTGGQPAADALPGDIPPPPKELIPKEWNVASEHSVEVKKGGPFVFDFDIATKGK
jgi:hypothetical protein